MTLIDYLTSLKQFIHSYFLIITIIAVIFFILGLLLIFNANKNSSRNSIEDLSSIAGEDAISTQLDLARAYLEMDKKILAKDILDHIMQHGNPFQKGEAKDLLAKL